LTQNAEERGRRWRLDGRRALVTGGTKGIGEGVAAELLALGARVTVVARDAAVVAARVGAWQENGFPAFGVAADVTIPEGRAAALETAVGAMGGLDILVNNVGTNIRKPSIEYTAEEVAHLLHTNTLSAWEMCRAAYPYLKAAADAGGDAAIVGVGSVAGTLCVGSGAPYAMTKAATDQLTRYLAVEWAADGIRVNEVNPWYTFTPLASPILNQTETRERILARTPNGRIADPADIASVVAFLCLPAARHVTGQCLAVDGGMLANGRF
jgi:tropinone reductase I